MSTVIIWRLSELSLYFYKASGSTNETPVNFSFILQALEWLFLQGELGDKRQSLDLCQYPPTEPVLGSILLGPRTDRHKGSKTSTGPVRSPALLCNPRTCAEPSPLLSNIKKYFVCCFKEAQANSGFFTRQIKSLGKVILILPWISFRLVEASSSEEVWIHSKQQQSNYFHFINEITFRVGMSELLKNK